MRILSPRNKFAIIIIFAALTVSSLTAYFTNKFVKELAEEERFKIDLWANAVKYISTQSDSCQDFSFIFDVIQNNKTVPVILTDEIGKVIGYRNIDIQNINDTISVNKIINRMRTEHEQITINLPDGSKNYVYYFDSTTLNRIYYYPYIQLFTIFIFILISFLSYRQSRKSEQNFIWLGMAKETAHQLGTPTSSLIACSIILKEKYANDEIVSELNKDVMRIETITNRFSQIGTPPRLQRFDVKTIIQESVSYQSKRSPYSVLFTIDIPYEHIFVEANQTLLMWVFENIYKNAIDAMSGEGIIAIVAFCDAKRAYIDIKDNGKGIEKSKFKDIFRAGYSTKERGWGIGLSLSKRIVEIYHKGKIFVLRSEIGAGTTIRIILPRA